MEDAYLQTKTEPVIIRIQPGTLSNRLDENITPGPHEKRLGLKATVQSTFDIDVFLPTTTLLASITLEKLKEIEWYYERYATVDPFSTNRAAAVEKLLFEHGVELLKNIINERILPNDKRHGSFIIHILSGEQQGSAEQAWSSFFWEILENVDVWESALRFQPTSVCVVRTHESPGAYPTIKPDLAVSRILILTARLTGKEDISHKLITRAIHNIAYKATEHQSQVQLDFVRPGTFSALQAALEIHGPGHIDVLHLDLHGTVDEDGRALLYFVKLTPDLKIQPDPVEVEALASLLLRYGVGVVVLNACRSAANTGTSSNLAAELVKAGINAAVGMQYNVLSRSAEIFVKQFYGHLLLRRASVLQAMTLARAHLIENNFRETKFGHSVSLQDFLVPVLHLQGYAFNQLLKNEEPYPFKSSATSRDLEQVEDPDIVVGRDGDLLYLETIMPELAVPCLNIYGTVGIGKSAFLRDIQKWWIDTGFVQHCCHISCSGLSCRDDQLANQVQTTITELKNTCVSQNDGEQCNHRTFVIIDDLDPVSWSILYESRQLQKNFRSMIRRNQRTFFAVSSRTPIHWLTSSLAIEYGLKPLSFGYSFDVASRLLVSQKAKEDVQQNSTSRSCYEELVEFCCGNPLALKIMGRHINHVFVMAASATMPLVFDEFLKLGLFYVSQEDVLSWTDGVAAKSLLELLDALGDLPITDIPSWSGDLDQDNGEQECQDQPFSTSQFVSLVGLGAFCCSIPDDLEPYIITVSLLQCLNSNDVVDGAALCRRFVTTAIERAEESKTDLKDELWKILNLPLEASEPPSVEGDYGSLADYILQHAIEVIEWLSDFMAEHLQEWIYDYKVPDLEVPERSGPQNQRLIHPVLTMLLRGMLTDIEDYQSIREDIRLALANNMRHETIHRWKKKSYDGLPSSWTTTVRPHIEDQFLNFLVYATNLKFLIGTDDTDWLCCEHVRAYAPSDTRREQILSYCGLSFLGFACTLLETVKGYLPAFESSTTTKASQESAFTVWRDMSALERCAGVFLACTIQYRFYHYLSMEGLRPLLQRLQNRPLTPHLPVEHLRAEWRIRMQVCQMYLDAGEGKRMFTIADDVELVRNQLAALTYQKERAQVTEPCEDASVTDQLKYIRDASKVIQTRSATITTKLHEIREGKNEDDLEDEKSVTLAIEALLAEEVRTSNDPISKIILLRDLAYQNEKMGNFDIAATQQQRVTELMSSLDNETAMLYGQRGKLIRLYGGIAQEEEEEKEDCQGS